MLSNLCENAGKSNLMFFFFKSLMKLGQKCNCVNGFIERDGACHDVNECEEKKSCPGKVQVGRLGVK